MAEALGTEIAKICLEKPISGAFNEAYFALQIKSHIKRLEKITKPIIEAWLQDADAAQPSSRVQHLALEQVSCALEQLHHILEATAGRAKQKQNMSRSPMRKVLWFFSPSSNPIVCAFRDARKVKAFIDELDSIAREHMRLGNILRLPSDTLSRRQTLCLETGPLTSEEIIGRDDDRDTIIKMLLESSSCQESFSVVSIVGIGGMGKTTLAQYVFNDERVKQHFDIRIWIYVPQVLGQSIVAFASNGNRVSCEIAQMQHHLRAKLFGKKYLLVLDNIWDDENLDLNWQALRTLLGFGSPGSMVLTTTRSAKVAKTMGVVEPYVVRDLARDDSWRLFQRLALTQGVEPRKEVIGKEIVQKCLNVPLLIHSIGRHLGGKATIREWEDFKDKLVSSSYYEQVPRVMQTIKLTYDELDPRLKLCFAYCSLFPYHSLCTETELIYLWIALDYIKTPFGNQSLVHKAKDCILYLREKGLLIDNDNNWMIQIHDVIHDLALSVAGSKYKMVDSESFEFDETIRHVSFIRNTHISGNFPCSSLLKTKKQLQSLLMLPRCRALDDPKLQLKGLSKFKCLRVLGLRGLGLEKVPRTIGKLIHLRYLDLSSNYLIKKLPNSITQLPYLVFLKLHQCCSLEELPRDINKLQTLICLDLSGCYNLRKSPRDIRNLVNLRQLYLDGWGSVWRMPLVGLGNMTNLHTLDFFAARGWNSSPTNVTHSLYEPYDHNVEGLAELNHLSNLEGKLTIAVDGIWLSESEAKAANLQGKRKLTELSINFIGGFDRDNEVMLEGFQPHDNLRKLEIKSYRGQRLPSWINDQGCNFLRLEEICVSDWESDRLVGSFGKLPHLRNLIITHCENLEYIEITTVGFTHSIAPLFPNLEMLTLESLPNLNRWGDICYRVGADANVFPKLKKLTLDNVGLEVVPEEFRGLSSLESLKIESCEHLGGIEEWVATLTSLKKLYITSCPELTSLLLNMAKLSNLEKLKISNCLGLKERLKGEDKLHIPLFPKLKKLTLQSLGLQVVPMEFKGLSLLEFFDIYDCGQFKELPEWIDTFTSLKYLRIRKCPKLNSLPKQIANLANLKMLTITTNCPEFKERYQNPTGQDWHLIQHVPELVLYFY